MPRPGARAAWAWPARASEPWALGPVRWQTQTRLALTVHSVHGAVVEARLDVVAAHGGGSVDAARVSSAAEGGRHLRMHFSVADAGVRRVGGHLGRDGVEDERQRFDSNRSQLG